MRIAAAARQRIATRLAAWIRERQGADALPIEIHRKRLYILPTRAGAGFAVLLFGMLLAGLNYANNLALLVTFLFGGLVLATMHMCHRNLLGARIVSARTEAAFAGHDGSIELLLENPDAVARADWSCAVGRSAPVTVDLAPRDRAVVRLPLSAPRRGVYPVDRVRLATRFPFGFFRAWSWLHLPLEFVVYPAARGTLALRDTAGARSGEQERVAAGDDEWRDLRAYRDGDAPRRIAWKAYARGGPLLVKEYAAAGSELHEFDYARLLALAPEARLEQLARWIVDAEQRGEPYALRLPGAYVSPGSGAQHRDRCLTALARHPAEGAAP
jgi:uncharacterized protein (DUF58 family)